MNIAEILTEFCFNTPLYTPYKIENEAFFNDIKYHTTVHPFSGYNPIDKFESTFHVQNFAALAYTAKNFEHVGGYADMTIFCRRSHRIFRFNCFYDIETKELIKNGQYPSLADFHIGEVKDYKSYYQKKNSKNSLRPLA